MSVLINNSEQVRVEHQLIVNKLKQELTPQEVVDNGTFKMLQEASKKAVGAVGRTSKRLSKAAGGTKVGKAVRRKGAKTIGRTKSAGRAVGGTKVGKFAKKNRGKIAAGGAGVVGGAYTQKLIDR
jgi:hypothetical protein